MHELSLCQRLVEIINQQAADLNCKRVTKVSLEIGQLIAIDPAAFRFGFEVVAVGTLAEKAHLEIIEIKGQAHCEVCQKTVTLNRYYDACSTCGEFSLTIVQGEELRVKSMEVV